MDGVFAEFHVLILAGIRRQDGENDFLVLLTGEGTHDDDVFLVFGVGHEVGAAYFFLDVFRDAIGGS